MTDTIKTGTILVETGALMPQSLGLENKPYASGCLGQQSRSERAGYSDSQAGWTFFFMPAKSK